MYHPTKTLILAASVTVGLLSAACYPTTRTPPSTATAEAVTTDTPRPTTVPTTPPVPTRTPNPSPTIVPSYTFTPTPEPGQRILIQYGWYGGDGGGPWLYYLGRDMPSFILYLDGHLLIREGGTSEFDWAGEGGYTYSTTMLSEVEICELLGRIADTGFFELEDDGGDFFTEPTLYTFYGDDPETWPPFGEGAPMPLIQVNSDPAHFVMIFTPWLDYLIPEVEAVYTLLNTYRPDGLELYQPDRMLLYIERGHGWFMPEDNITPTLWPADLPPLPELYAESVIAPPLLGSTLEDLKHIPLEGELAAAVFDLFGNRMRPQVYMDGESDYFLIARPLLPHETAEEYSTAPYGAESFPLPFDCDE